MTTTIFLTGMPGVGKTTCLQTVAKTLEQQKPTLSFGGFYTQERRSNSDAGSRIGFDIIVYNATNNMSSKEDEANNMPGIPLARVGSTKPKVGKYSVCLENVRTHMVESLKVSPSTAILKDATSTSNPRPHLTVIDEVGKMELLCPEFFPTVCDHLDDSHKNLKGQGVATIGTLPLPKKPIQQVQQIIKRKDVLVLLVTHANRNQLAQDLTTYLLQSSLFRSCVDGQPTVAILDPYVFDPTNHKAHISNKQPQKKDMNASPRNFRHQNPHSLPQIESLKSCPPMLSKGVPPKILLLGETASPLPEDLTLAYNERSMWKLLTKVVPLLSVSSDNSTATQEQQKDEEYRSLQYSTLSHGIAIWDVLSNVHHPRQKEKGRRKKKQSKQLDMPNDLVPVLDSANCSIRACCFIGSKAYQTFVKHFQSQTSTSKSESKNNTFVTPGGRSIDLVVLPSSSNGNRMPLADKVTQWKDSFDKYGCGN